MAQNKYHIVPFPKFNRSAVDAGRLGRHKHIMHALIEVDVTKARRFIREHRQLTGEKLSFTAFVINCLGKAVEQNKRLQAFRNWRGQLVILEDVPIKAMLEVEKDGKKLPFPHIFRSVNHKNYRDIHQELRTAQQNYHNEKGMAYMRIFLKLPWFIRRFFYWLVTKVPTIFPQYTSEVMVTAVGMFFDGVGWGIPKPNNTLTVALGPIVEKPVVRKGQIVIREIMHVTLSINHDIVYGAPAARFSKYFKELIESGYGLTKRDDLTEKKENLITTK